MKCDTQSSSGVILKIATFHEFFHQSQRPRAVWCGVVLTGAWAALWREVGSTARRRRTLIGGVRGPLVREGAASDPWS